MSRKRQSTKARVIKTLALISSAVIVFGLFAATVYFEEVPSVGVTAVTTEMQQICDAQNEEVSICLPVQ